MKITWQPVSQNLGVFPIILGDDSLPRRAGMKLILSTSPAFQWNVQTAAPVRARATSQWNRRNLQTVYRFRVAYQFADADQCNQFLLDLGKQLNDIPEGILTVNFNTGAVRLLRGGSLAAAVTQEQVGVSCQVDYTVVGGEFSNT